MEQSATEPMTTVPKTMEETTTEQSTDPQTTVHRTTDPQTMVHRTTEQKLCKAYREFKPRPIPKTKELNEALAFFKATQKFMGGKDVVVDVCGSHGMIAVLYAVYRKARHVIVLDTSRPQSFDNVCRVWGDFIPTESVVEFLVADMHKDLPPLLQGHITGGRKVGVVACHACAHLTDEIIDICASYQVDFAVMGCCPKDRMTKGQVKSAASLLNMDFAAAFDLVRMGRIIEKGYDARWKVIDPKITPMNRILFGLAGAGRDERKDELRRVREEDEGRLSRVYAKAYQPQEQKVEKESTEVLPENSDISGPSELLNSVNLNS